MCDQSESGVVICFTPPPPSPADTGRLQTYAITAIQDIFTDPDPDIPNPDPS